MEVSINYNELIIRGGLDKNKHKSINLHFQDESRFGLFHFMHYIFQMFYNQLLINTILMQCIRMD